MGRGCGRQAVVLQEAVRCRGWAAPGWIGQRAPHGRDQGTQSRELGPEWAATL